MNSISKLFDIKRIGYVGAAFAVLMATVLPSLAMAAQITERSIQLSSSSANAEDTIYTINFNATTDAGAFVIDFCTSPAIGTVCTAPDGFDASGAIASNTPAFTNVTKTANKIVVTSAIDVSTEDTVTGSLSGIDNPSDADVFYARIVTFDNVTDANAYNSSSVSAANPGANARDQGGVAMSITPTIGVTGAVLETLIFCAASVGIVDTCDGDLTAPNIKLGTNGVLGVDPSEGKIYTQISTNAASGAVVNLKSSTTGCGGLMRNGETDPEEGCGIKPVTGANVTAIGQSAALFGLKLADIDPGTGAIRAVPASGYGTTNFFMGYDDGDDTGITSTYGDPIYDTENAPISNGEANLVFAANIGNDTPAGAYSATLSLIATGKF